MKISNQYKLLALAAIVPLGSLALLWLGVEAFDASALTLCAGLLGVGVIIFAGYLTESLLRLKRQQQQFQHYIEALCLCHNQPGLNDNVPHLPASNQFQNLAEKLYKILADNKCRIEDLEHTRTAQEIRCLRAMSKADQIKTIFEGLADPILAFDDYDELVLANHSAEDVFHFESDKIENRAMKQIVHCQRLTDLLSSVRQRKVTSSRSEDIELIGEDGGSQWYRATACKLAESDEIASGKSSVSEGAVVVLRNISDHKALQKRNADFVSSVSHEMKTPLAGIKAYVELLADGEAEDEETREEFLGVITTQADRLQRLVENMLNIARIEAGVVHVNKQQRSLNEILEEAVRVVQHMADSKHINLVSQFSAMYLGIHADRDMLLQAAINLLSNAIKYTRENGAVTIRSRFVGDRVGFDVQDTGVGLSPEDCHKVFEKFYRVKKDKDMAPGTGLGLALVKNIIEDVHAGQLSVESTLGIGSTFSVTLPCIG